MLEETIERMLENREINLNELQVLMTPLERTILKVLMEKRTPLTVNEIKNILIADFQRILKHYDIEYLADPKRPGEPKIEYKKPGKTPEPLYWEGDYEFSPNTFSELGFELRKMEKAQNLPKYKVRTKIAGLLKKYGIVDIPSFNSINKILFEFEAQGLILSRDEVVGRGKKLYVINPKLINKEE